MIDNCRQKGRLTNLIIDEDGLQTAKYKVPCRFADKAVASGQALRPYMNTLALATDMLREASKYSKWDD